MDHAERPLIVFWEVTKACALACVHCRAWARRQPARGELTTDEGFALIDDLASLGAPAPRLVLTGGDPLERQDICMLIRHAKERGVPVAVAPAPGPRLTREALVALKDAGAWGVAISLDAPAPEEHDAFRRSAGSFARGCVALRWARELGFRTQVNSVAHGGNLRDLGRLFLLAHGLRVDAWEVIPLIPTGRASRLPTLSADEMESLLHFLYDAGGYGVRVHAAEAPASRRVALARRSGAPPPVDTIYRALLDPVVAELGVPRPNDEPLGTTRSGHGVGFVGADGAVTPSGFLSLAAGNVRDAPLSRIYCDTPLFRSLRDEAGFHGPCGSCAYRRVCGGSRARAFALTGDPLASDPSCVLAQTVPHPRAPSAPTMPPVGE